MGLSDKTFLLGIGAQKAGTSWLYEYLAMRREIFMSPIKEMHVFDVIYRPDLMDDFNARFINQLSMDLQGVGPRQLRGDLRLQGMMDRVRMIYDPSAYVTHFARYAGSETRYFGEVTPSYSLLPDKGFAEIARLFPRRKIIFLLRDPIERVYSQVRMRERQGRFEGPAIEQFIPALEDPTHVERTMYHLTWERLMRIFSRDEIFVGFYETFFCDEEIGRLCRFLDIPFQPGRYDVVVNPSPLEVELDEEKIRRAREVFAPAYDFCKATFGDQVPSSWRF